MSPAPDQTPAVAYGLYSEEPIRTPGGGLIMPDLPPEALARKAKLARLTESSSWAEIVLQDWFRRLAVFGVSASFDIDRFERATMVLWRLTAVAKSIFALEDNPNTPIPPSLEPAVNTLVSDASSLSSAGFQPASSPPPISNPAHDQDNSSSLGPRTASSADIPVSQPATPSSITPTADPSPRSALATPQSPSLPSLSVRAVPSCPTLSPEGIATFLSRCEVDLAEATRRTPPILDLPQSQSSAGILPALFVIYSSFHIPHFHCPASRFEADFMERPREPFGLDLKATS